MYELVSGHYFEVGFKLPILDSQSKLLVGFVHAVCVVHAFQTSFM